MKKLFTLLCACALFFFCNAQCPLSNGGFENGLSGWNVTGDVQISSDAQSGNSAVEICNAGSEINQIISTQPGKSYTVSISGKRLPGHVLTMFKFRTLNSSWQPQEINGGTNFIFQNFENGDGSPGVYFNQSYTFCLLYTSPSPRDATLSRMPSSA